jgi:quercetin dioxygenase-like cupin family protein
MSRRRSAATPYISLILFFITSIGGRESVSGRITRAEEVAWSDHSKYTGVRAKVLVGADTNAVFSTHLVQLAPGASIDMHGHSDALETMYCVAGAGVSTIEGESHPFVVGTSMHAPLGVPHELRNTGDETLEMLCIFSPPRG